MGGWPRWRRWPPLGSRWRRLVWGNVQRPVARGRGVTRKKFLEQMGHPFVIFERKFLMTGKKGPFTFFFWTFPISGRGIRSSSTLITTLEEVRDLSRPKSGKPKKSKGALLFFLSSRFFCSKNGDSFLFSFPSRIFISGYALGWGLFHLGGRVREKCREVHPFLIKKIWAKKDWISRLKIA